MATKGYTNAIDVQSQLGRALTDSQIAYLEERILPAVEEWIDKTGGRSYGEGVVTAEVLVMAQQYTYLSKTPVVNVQAVRGWYWGQQATDIITLSPSLYTLVRSDNGYFRVPGWRNYEHLEVDYTPDPAIPARISLAATLLSMVYMRTVLHPQTDWLTDYASGQDVRLKFRDITIPENVYELVGSYGDNYVIA